jgi:hypothetical protein
MPKRTYTPGEIAWLAEGYKHWRAKELAERYAVRFGRPIAANSIRQLLNRRGFQCGRPRGLAKGEGLRTWTREQIAWLRRYRPHNTLADTTRQFNAYWGLGYTPSQLDGTCQRNGIHRQEDTRYQPGLTPWNKGLAGYDSGGRSHQTRFQAGRTPWTTLPVGSYCQDSEGYWRLKVSDAEQRPGFARRNWAHVHRLTWEAAHGPVPRGHAVVFVDGDPDHCLDPANLACISRAVLARLNQMGWTAARDPDARRALIALATLHQAAHDKARGAKLSRRERREAIPRMAACHDRPICETRD